MEDFIEKQCEEIRKTVGSKKILLGLSGGVDSSVCAALISKAVPGQLICVFVDHGFMRKNEGDEIERAFSDKNMHFIRVNAEKTFLNALKGVKNPEKKRKIIGKLFIDVFEETAKKLGAVEDFFFAQGTIYPDISESGAEKGKKLVKSHHNVGGLPERIKFRGIIEPLKTLYKKGVRTVGAELGLPLELVNRQPFPGPGLAVRVVGVLTKKKLDALRDADYIFRTETESAGVRASQYFAILTNTRSVGVVNEKRVYGYTVALRAVCTEDFVISSFVEIPYPVLAKCSARITREVKNINRVVYDVTNKPPATIEWE